MTNLDSFSTEYDSKLLYDVLDNDQRFIISAHSFLRAISLISTPLYNKLYSVSIVLLIFFGWIILDVLRIHGAFVKHLDNEFRPDVGEHPEFCALSVFPVVVREVDAFVGQLRIDNDFVEVFEHRGVVLQTEAIVTRLFMFLAILLMILRTRIKRR